MSKKEELKERRKRVKELYKEGEINQKIATILNISIGTVENDISYLKKQGEIRGKIKRKIKERREKVKELYKEGKENQEIADILTVSIQTVANDIFYLKTQREITGQERIEKRKKEVKNLEHQGNEKSKRYERINSYIYGCIRKGEIQQAVDYAKSHENSQYLTEDEREKIKKFIQQTESKQVKTILELCKVGKTQREILKITKFSEGIIYGVCNSYRRTQENGKEK